MITETIFLGILLGFIYYEIVGLTPGGVIVPGYIALYLYKPAIIASTLCVVLITFFMVKGLSQITVLYGRRAFLAAVIIGFLLKWCIESYLLQFNPLNYNLEIIGYIIPGLIANEMRKQGIAGTFISLLIVSGVVQVLVQVYTFTFMG